MNLFDNCFKNILQLLVMVVSLNASIANANEIINQPPNVIVIFTDDQGYEDVGIFGGDHVETPQLDKMAAEGMQLTDFYVAAPLCTPSRSALMTGSYPRRIDMATGSKFPVLLAGDAKGLNPDEITLAEIMKSQGYVTGMFGKWHLGDQVEFMPTKQGFDEFFGLPYSHDISPKHRRQADFKFPDLPLLEGETVIEVNPDPEYLTRRITDKAINFIERNQEKPFFVYLPHPMPHGPWHVSKEFMTTIGNQTKKNFGFTEQQVRQGKKVAMYPLVIGELDQAVGEIIDTSDNGPIGKRNPDGSERLLAGHKTKTQEGGLRVPTIVWAPGKIAQGSVSHELTTSMDIFPTIAWLAGAKLPTDRIIDGKNIWPILTGENGAKSPHEAFFYFRENTIEAVRKGQWKLAIKGDSPGLYHLAKDISEKHDLSPQYPDKITELTALITQFEAGLGIDKQGLCSQCRPAGYVDDPQFLSLPTKALH
jgi:arylsulfatase A